MSQGITGLYKTGGCPSLSIKAHNYLFIGVEVLSYCRYLLPMAPWPWWPNLYKTGGPKIFCTCERILLFVSERFLCFLRSLAMSSSKPSSKPTLAVATDPWDLLTPSASSPAPSSGTVSTAPSLQVTSSSSGEFNAFSFVGAAVSAGSEIVSGGGNEKSLFLVVEDGGYCLGNISGSKFCTKLCVDGKSCGIPTHASRKARVLFDHVYILENESKAFFEPRLDIKALEDQQLKLILSRRFPKEQWNALFVAMDQGNYPDWLLAAQAESTVDVTASLEDVLTLKSPKQAVAKTGIFGIFPALSYDDEDDIAEDLDIDPTDRLQSSVAEFKHRFARLKHKWTSVFQDVEVGHLLITADLDKVSDVTNKLVSYVGQPIEIDGTTPANLWQALSQINVKLQEGITQVQDSTNYLSDMLDEVATNSSVVQDAQLLLQTSISSIQDTLRKHETRFGKILPVLMNVHQSSPSVSMIDIDQRLAKLSQAIEDLQDKQWQSTLTPNTSGSNVQSSSQLEADMRDIKAQLQTLQLRIVGNGVQIGGMVFQCFEDVKTWVSAKFQIKRYGLFVDGVSLLDFFSFVSHTDTEKSMSAFYNQVKSGFASMYEARVAASTQNLFPMIFGRSQAGGMDDSQFLPALHDPDKWDNGITGLRYQISRGMSDVEIQLESTIDSVLKDYPEPRQIAKECLYKSKRFVMDLCSFITQDFQKWQHRGHSTKDSWRMTSVCVRRVFEEIHSQRVVARDILDVQDGDFSCAKFLWATWKAHETMALYVRHQFYEHPSIAAVLARHLADNHVKPDEAVSSKVGALDKAIKNINARLDSVQCIADRVDKEVKATTQNIKDLSKEVKDLNVGGGTGGGGGKHKTKPKDKDPKPSNTN